MALIRSLARLQAERSRKHSRVDAGFRITSDPEAGTVVQIDTYGSDNRTLTGKGSQTIQFDQYHAKRMLEVFREAFPGFDQK